MTETVGERIRLRKGVRFDDLGGLLLFLVGLGFGRFRDDGTESDVGDSALLLCTIVMDFGTCVASCCLSVVVLCDVGWRVVSLS